MPLFRRCVPMARPASRHPTELELEILKILWRDGPSSVRHVREALTGFRDLAYTSVMTIMTIMTRKRYLRRSKAEGGYVYRARITQESTTGRMLRDLVNRAFDGSAAALMLNLLETNEIDAHELKRLRELINEKA
jgi:BlaI family penicillinase repressor